MDKTFIAHCTWKSRIDKRGSEMRLAKDKKIFTCVERHAHVLLIEIHRASSEQINKQKGKH